MRTGKWLKNKTLALTALMVFGISAPIMAAENQEPLTLQQIVDTALKNNPTVVEQQKRWEEKKGRVPLVTAQPNPKFGIMKDDIPTSSKNPFDGMMTDFSLTQEIMNPVKLKSMGKMAENDALMTKSGYQDKQIEVYTATKLAYYDLLYAGQALAIGKESQQIMGQLTQIAQVNYSTGMVSLQDALKAQTEFSKMTIDLLNMASMEAVSKAKLNTLMGRASDSPLLVKEEFNAPPPNFDLTALQKTASELKPSVLGMKYQVDMAQNGLELAKKQQLPDYELQLGYKRYKKTDMPENDKSNTWRIGVMAMIPIWQDKNQAQIKSAVSTIEATKATLTNMQNMTTLDIQMSLVEAQSAWRQIDLYKNTIIPQAEQTYQAGVVGYTNGKVDFMAVLDSLNAMRNVKLDYYKARVTYEKATANLEKAVGKPMFTSVALP
ncbi:TolC family protein [Pelosinus sp. sgz500959]|uniref:TolC family protein n=1 Tax=Pelosinus sp. sgz500959 TaxID=3242472 RepID=UPI00367144AD